MTETPLIQAIPPKELYLRQAIGEVECGPHKMKVDAVIPGGSIYVAFATGERYLVSLRAILERVVDFHEEVLKENADAIEADKAKG